MNTTDVARKYLRASFGNMIQLGEETYDEVNKRHRFRLRSNYPFMIVDDSKPNPVTVRVLKMENLGDIFLDSGLSIDKDASTKREEADKRIHNILAHWKRRIEQVVAETTSDRLANLDQFRQFFMPVQRIVYYILETGFMSDSVIEKASLKPTGKLSRYMNLLEGANILTREGDGWKASLILKELDQKSDNKNELMRRLISDLIKTQYDNLRELMRLNVLHRTIRLQNVIYLPEIEVTHSLKRNADTIRREYYYHYGIRVNEVDIISNLVGLTQVNAVAQEKSTRLFYGDEELLEQMVSQVAAMPSLSALGKRRA